MITIVYWPKDGILVYHNPCSYKGDITDKVKGFAKAEGPSYSFSLFIFNYGDVV